MVIIILGVFAEIVASQLAGRPCLVKGMAKQVILLNPRVELVKKFGGVHKAP
jgi:hypothetical protein